LGEWVTGALEATDPVDSDGFVYDGYLLPGELAGLARVTVESDDFDTYLELELPEDGGYEVHATSYLTELGKYRLRIGPDLDVQPDPAAGGVILTAEERAGLQWDPERVWNDPLGFTFPSPGADFLLMDESEVTELMGEGAPNVRMWLFQDVMETAQLLVVAIKAPAAPDSATVRLVGEMMAQSTGGWSFRETMEGLEIR
jgi:hypothetical protein